MRQTVLTLNTGEELVIRDGELLAIYTDTLAPYIYRVAAELGLPESAVVVERATHVEPTTKGGWRVDLSPVGGPAEVLVDERGQPFNLRQAALDFELRWLREHWLKLEGEISCSFFQGKKDKES